MGKSSTRSSNYRLGTSRPHGTTDTFRHQMAATSYPYARGEALIALRENRHLTQEQAAVGIGTTPKTLRSWERNAPISPRRAAAAAAFYRVDVESITTRDPHNIGVLTRIEQKLDALLSAHGIEWEEAVGERDADGGGPPPLGPDLRP